MVKRPGIFLDTNHPPLYGLGTRNVMQEHERHHLERVIF